MIVHVGSILHSYTGGKPEVDGRGSSVGAVLADLDERFPGLRFRVVDEQNRIRQHIRIYVGETPATGIDARVEAGEDIHILAALSGG